MRLLVIGLVLLGLTHSVFSQQKQIETRNEFWLHYINQSRFTDRSGAWFDFQTRLTDQLGFRSTIERIGYTYFIGDNLRLAAAYGYVTQFTDNKATSFEHQPFEQIQWFGRKEKFTIMQWVRLEERFRKNFSGESSDGYTFSYRIRYNLLFMVPLKGQLGEPNTIFILMNNEIFANFGKSIINNYFDQNRSAASLAYQLTQRFSANIGYMYIFQQLQEPNNYRAVHAFRLSFIHNLDFRGAE